MSIDAGTGNPLPQPSQPGSALCCMCPADRLVLIHILVATCSRLGSGQHTIWHQVATNPAKYHILLPTKPLSLRTLVSTASKSSDHDPLLLLFHRTEIFYTRN